MPADTGNRLLAEISSQLRAGQDTVSLRQIDLANVLQVSAVTVRRHTRRLQEAGLLLARRGRNIISYTVTAARRVSAQVADEAQPRLIGTSEPDATPTPAPVYVAGITARKPERPGKSNAKCPAHHKARRSWMSDQVGLELYHCPATTGHAAHCSWIYSPNLGQIRPPGRPEITLPELHAAIAGISTQADYTSAPPAPVVDNDSPAQTAWSAITNVMTRWTQPADVNTFLLPAKGTAYDGRTLEVTAAQPSHLRWLQQSFAMRFIGNAIKEALGHPVELRYRIAGVPS